MDKHTNYLLDYELERAQKTLISLYKISLKLERIDDKKSYPFSIYLGDDSDLADGTLDKRVLNTKKEIFEKLQKEKIVANFIGPLWEDEYPGSDMGGSHCYVNGEFYPNKVILCLEKSWKPKQGLSKEIVYSYRILMELVETYLMKPLLSDNLKAEEKNRESNELYCLLSNKIEELFKNLDKSLAIRSLGFTPYIPFTSLFSAIKELKKRRLSRADIMANMADFYGKLTEVENSFKLEKYREPVLNLREIKNHISQLKKINDEKNTSNKKALKIKLSVSKLNGICYVAGKVKYSYPIKGKRFNIIQLLKDGRKPGNIIANIQKRPIGTVIKEIGLINKKFKKCFEKIHIKDDIVVRIPTGGYGINHEKFDIIFLD